MKNWKFQSNRLDEIYLHDNVITEFVKEGNDVILLFNDIEDGVAYGFDVCKENPLNNTGKHKLTGRAAIILKDFSLLEGKEHLVGNVTNTLDEDHLFDGHLHDQIVSSFEWNDHSKTFTLYSFPDENPSKYYRIDFVFHCSEAFACWNEFVQDSWFEETE